MRTWTKKPHVFLSSQSRRSGRFPSKSCSDWGWLGRQLGLTASATLIVNSCLASPPLPSEDLQDYRIIPGRGRSPNDRRFSHIDRHPGRSSLDRKGQRVIVQVLCHPPYRCTKHRPFHSGTGLLLNSGTRLPWTALIVKFW